MTQRRTTGAKRQGYTFQIPEDAGGAPNHSRFPAIRRPDFPIQRAGKHCPTLAPQGPAEWPANVDPEAARR